MLLSLVNVHPEFLNETHLNGGAEVEEGGNSADMGKTESGETVGY